MSQFIARDLSTKRDLKPFKVLKIGKNDVVVNYGGVYNCIDLSRVDVDKTKKVWIESDLKEIYLTATDKKLTVFLEVEHESKSSIDSDSWAKLVSARVDIDSEVPEADDTKVYLELAKLKMEDLGDGDEVALNEGIIEQEVWIAIRGEGSDSSEESSEESSDSESSSSYSESDESASEESDSDESESNESGSDESESDSNSNEESDQESDGGSNESDYTSDSDGSDITTSDDSNGDSGGSGDGGDNGSGNSDDDSSSGPSYNPNFHIISIDSFVISGDGYGIDIEFSYEEGDGVGWVDIQYRRVGRLTYYISRYPLPGPDPGGPHSASIPSLEVSDGTYITGEDPDNSNPSAPAIAEATYLGTGDVFYL